MNFKTLKLIISQTRKSILKQKKNVVILILVWVFGCLSLLIQFSSLKEGLKQNQTFREEVRHGWESRPDKHPHRMAHYGYLTFRDQFPLMIFDKGIDDYLGNMIFLEAHKQNTANLSEAGSSGSLVRFGSFSLAFILQILVPLILFFIGFNLVSEEKENNTLKILHLQNVSAKEIIWGKMLSLWQYALLFLLPFLPICFILMLLVGENYMEEVAFRLLFVFGIYALLFLIISTITIVVSALSKSSAHALVFLLGCWLFLAVFLPKITQFMAQNFYTTPERIAFEMDMEATISKIGDSHNPNDVHYKKLKDSLLKAYKVDTVTALPFNYAGFVMKEGEKLTSKIYRDKLENLQNIYIKQLKILEISGFLNPITMIKNLSMGFSGTDYYSYQDFQNQSETYRFYLAQRMNDLQIKYISNIKPKESEKPLSISHKHWKETKDFHYEYPNFWQVMRFQSFSLLALIFWILVSFLTLNRVSQKLKFL